MLCFVDMYVVLCCVSCCVVLCCIVVCVALRCVVPCAGLYNALRRIPLGCTKSACVSLC